MHLSKYATPLQLLVLILGFTPSILSQKTTPVIQQSGEELLKRITNWKEPPFPPIARQAGAGGPMVVELLIDEQGSVTSAQVVSGHPLLRAAFQQAARTWKFRPYVVKGVPARIAGRVTYDYPISEEAKRNSVDELEKITRDKPGSAEAHYNLGVEYLGLNRYDEARIQLSKAIQIDPKDSYAHLKLGHVYMRLNSQQKAIEEFTEAARLNPQSSEAFHAMGLAHMALAEYQLAIKAFKASLEVEDPITTSHFALGKSYVMLDRPGESLEHYKRGLVKYPDSDLGHYGLGEAYFLLERYEEAMAEFKEAIKLSDGPGKARAHFFLGFTYLKIGDAKAAQQQYDLLKNLDAALATELMDLIRKAPKRRSIS